MLEIKATRYVHFNYEFSKKKYKKIKNKYKKGKNTFESKIKQMILCLKKIQKL